MKRVFLFLAVAMCSTLAMAQTNQYFWAGGQFIMGNPINQIDSITFGQLDNTDSVLLYLPRTVREIHDTIIQKEIVHDTVFVYDCNKLANWNGFIIESLEDSTIVEFGTAELDYEFDCSGIPGSLWYSEDATDWTEWICSSQLMLNKGQKIALKGNRNCYHKSNTGYYHLSVIQGSCKEYGYINSLFENSDKYTKISFSDISLMYFFQGKCYVTLSFPEGVTELGSEYLYSYAFARNGHVIEGENYGITQISLPSTLQKIGCTCFEGALIKEITIPKSVNYIGSHAFHGCTKLTKVTYLGTISEWNNITKENYKGNTVANHPQTNIVHCIDGDAAF